MAQRKAKISERESIPYEVPPDAKWVRAVQVYNSGRWPIGRFTFYNLVESGRIVRHFPVPNGRPVYSVSEIDRLFEESAEHAANF